MTPKALTAVTVPVILEAPIAATVTVTVEELEDEGSIMLDRAEGSPDWNISESEGEENESEERKGSGLRTSQHALERKEEDLKEKEKGDIEQIGRAHV